MKEPKYFLVQRHCRKCESTSLSRPPAAEWMITPAGVGNDQWTAWRISYSPKADEMQWLPLNETFPDVASAQRAVKEFLTTRDIAFLNETGELITA